MSGRKDTKAGRAVDLDSSGGHECNFYCRDDVHCFIAYSLEPLTDDIVAFIDLLGRRIDILERRPAPEVPPVDPTDPSGIEWPFRTYWWGRA